MIDPLSTRKTKGIQLFRTISQKARTSTQQVHFAQFKQQVRTLPRFTSSEEKEKKMGVASIKFSIVQLKYLFSY